MRNCIPKIIKKQIFSASCNNLKSFSYNSETFLLEDDVFISFGSSPNFFRARISNIYYLNDINPSLVSCPKKRIRKKDKIKSCGTNKNINRKLKSKKKKKNTAVAN